MNGATFFIRPCPACGRHARILLDYLGKQVCCRHCGREFTADDPESLSAAPDGPADFWPQPSQAPNRELPSLSVDFNRHL